MQCMLSPRDTTYPASPAEINSGKLSREAGPLAKGIVSFGNSSFTDSPADFAMGASLEGHQGIMTFGNFAHLL